MSGTRGEEAIGETSAKWVGRGRKKSQKQSSEVYGTKRGCAKEEKIPARKPCASRDRKGIPRSPHKLKDRGGGTVHEAGPWTLMAPTHRRYKQKNKEKRIFV